MALVMQADDFVESYFDAWNHRDPVAVADHLAVDGVYRDVPLNSNRSHDELIIELREFFSTYRYRYELVGDILTNRDTIAFQYRMYLQNTRQSSRSGLISGSEFITLNGAAALCITDYYENADMGAPMVLADITAERSKATKYAKSGLSDEQLAEYKMLLDEMMSIKQAYLWSDLTLPRLADSMGCTVNHLSQVINSGFGMSFFDYVNQFRVAHAKNLLADSISCSGAVLNIAFMVGFNSNSAFYAAFKKSVGQTPAQYRRARQNKTH